MSDQPDPKYVRIVIHELRTPLTSIKAATEYMLKNQDNNLSEKQISFLKMIHSNSERIIKITGDFSSFHKLEYNLAEINIEPTGLKEVVEAAFSDMKSKIREKKNSLNFEPPEEPLFVLADSMWLREALGLVLERAIAYSPAEGEVLVEAKKPAKKSGSTGLVTVTITDQSPGIEVAEGASVFDKFADIFINGEIPPLKGSGMEFCTAQKIIQKFNGQMDIKTTKGKGNKFIIQLPPAEKKASVQ